MYVGLEVELHLFAFSEAFNHIAISLHSRKAAFKGALHQFYTLKASFMIKRGSAQPLKTAV